MKFIELLERQQTHISTLDTYNVIAFDYDGTLVDGPNSEILHRYINNNPNKKYVIITFRDNPSGLLANMNSQYPNSPTEDQFAGIYTIPKRVKQAYQDDVALRARTGYKGEFTRNEETYMHWKGRVCKKVGAEVLVDDDTNMVVKGIDRYGLVYHDPDQLFESHTLV